MKVWQIIENFDRQLENDIPEEEKIKWLLQLDESFQKELIEKYHKQYDEIKAKNQ